MNRKIVRRSLCALAVFLLMPFAGLSFAEEKPWTDQFLAEFEEVKTSLANIEKQQQEVAAKDAEIIAKLDQLRVWVRRK
jgi:hypothetical protein